MTGIKIIAVGKMKEKFYKDAFDEYAKRLGGYCRFECVEIPESTIDREAEAVIKCIDRQAYVTAMCIEGKKLSSTELSQLIESKSLNGVSQFNFIIGGSTGMSEKLKQRADLRLSMSDMTFPHHLFRVMLAEQIYRSFKISEGSLYHK